MSARTEAGVISGPVPPAASSAAVSSRMKSQRTRDTAPELMLRRALWRRGLRYRIDSRPLPGRIRPDIVFPGARVAVFVDGCFWHSCPDHGTMPRANRDWWGAKLTANRERDERGVAALEAAGWLALRVWEHEDMECVAQRIAEVVRQRVAVGFRPLALRASGESF